MAKAIVIITDGQPNFDTVNTTDKLILQIIVLVAPEPAETFKAKRIDTFVIISGAETPTQLTNAIEAKVKADVTLAMGLTLAPSDIRATKFAA